MNNRMKQPMNQRTAWMSQWTTWINWWTNQPTNQPRKRPGRQAGRRASKQQQINKHIKKTTQNEKITHLRSKTGAQKRRQFRLPFITRWRGTWSPVLQLVGHGHVPLAYSRDGIIILWRQLWSPHSHRRTPQKTCHTQHMHARTNKRWWDLTRGACHISNIWLKSSSTQPFVWNTVRIWLLYI